MLKEDAVAQLGERSLLLPAWIKTALAANDRLKLYLSILQSAARHAGAQDTLPDDWGAEIAHALPGDGPWLQELVNKAYLDDGRLLVPDLARLLDALANDLALMARPVCDAQAPRAQDAPRRLATDPAPDPERDTGRDTGRDLGARRDRWLAQLRALRDDEGLPLADIARLTHGQRGTGDSFHLLVMDLHKAVNALAARVANEELDGAHVWQIDAADRPRVQAFMRGLARTAPMKFSHPGLDTAVTRDGARLLIQNDIGTNDAHVIVIEVEGRAIGLTYSDLHVERFDFFRALLEELGFSWSVADTARADQLNGGRPYQMGRARLTAPDEERLLGALESLAARVVFLIDWNRARKRLQLFVRKARAIDLLSQAARAEHGHMGWLLAGGERLVYRAMQALDGEAFRFGDRLDEALGEPAACAFLGELLRHCALLLAAETPPALVEDEARMLLARALRRRASEFDLLAEHAAYCHALAASLADVLDGVAPASDALARAKNWERRADHILMEARQRAQRHPRWAPMVNLLERCDDIADALEESLFIHSMTQDEPIGGLPPEVNAVLAPLAATTLAAIQDLVRAVEIARAMGDGIDAADQDQFLRTLWRMLRAERLCDEQLRQARRAILRALHAQAAAFTLASELAATAEHATDALLALGHALRQMVLERSGIHA